MQDLSTKAHSKQLSDHTAQLGSLVTIVAEITKSLAALDIEVREGFRQRQTSLGTPTTTFEGGSGSAIVKGKEAEGSGDFVVNEKKEKENVTVDEYRIAAKRIKLPVFSGVDPVGWVARAEVYFSVQGTPSEMRIQYAQICMEGSTWHWFKVLRESDAQLDWEKFKHAMFDRYGESHFGNPFTQLKGLLQDGTVDEYIEAFEMLTAQIPTMSEDQYMGLFIGGLREAGGAVPGTA